VWPKYKPPARESNAYNKRRHAFIKALDLNPVFTPRVALITEQGSVRVGKTQQKEPRFPRAAQQISEGNYVIKKFPSASFEKAFPGFKHRRSKMCYISHVAVQFGVNPKIIKDLRALRRLFWRVDIHGHWDRLARRVNLQLREQSRYDSFKSTKPVETKMLTTKPLTQVKEICPLWGAVCESCLHKTCAQIRLRRKSYKA